MNTHKVDQPIALVVGLCSHGLAMSRALNSSGVEVHAFESNISIPGYTTNSAKIHLVSSVKSSSLVDDLLLFRSKIPSNRSIVLFPSNDNNVKVIGENIEKIKNHFILSWAHCSNKILALLLKDNIEKRCSDVGLNYPNSYVIKHLDDVKNIVDVIEFPIIAKPVTPQSSFKALRCNNAEELIELVTLYDADLPILVQHWIPGTDKDIFFGALYLDQGKVISTFIGQKLESYPLAMGQTTVAITSAEIEVLNITKEFFNGLNLSGPVSLEMKKDGKGRYWIIEPTVGRTDFWVQLCIAAGCNFLYTEYKHCLAKPLKIDSDYKQAIWFDSERDVTAAIRHSKEMIFSSKKATFTYLNSSDIKPFLRAFLRSFFAIFWSFLNKILKQKHQTNAVNKSNFTFTSYAGVDELPLDFEKLLISSELDSIFIGFQWYQNFTKFVSGKEGKTTFLCISDLNNHAVAIIPLWLKNDFVYGKRITTLHSLTNYYSPIFEMSLTSAFINKDDLYLSFFHYLKEEFENWHLLCFTPIKGDFKKAVSQSAINEGFQVVSFEVTKNYYEVIEENYEQYYKKLSSKTRNTLTRKVKKLDKLTKWDKKIYTTFDGLDEALKQYHDVYNHSWKIHEPYAGFIDGLARLAAKNNWLRLGILTIDGDPVACQLWLVVEDKAYIYKLAYKNNYQKFSPGTILINHMIKEVIEKDNVKLIDFLTGDDNYKKEWMSYDQNLFTVEVINHKTFTGKLLKIKNWLSRFKN